MLPGTTGLARIEQEEGARTHGLDGLLLQGWEYIYLSLEFVILMCVCVCWAQNSTGWMSAGNPSLGLGLRLLLY